MHQIWTVNESYSDCSDSLRNSAGDLSGNALKERRNVVRNTADTADGNAAYNTVMCNLVRAGSLRFQFRNLARPF